MVEEEVTIMVHEEVGEEAEAPTWEEGMVWEEDKAVAREEEFLAGVGASAAVMAMAAAAPALFVFCCV